MEAQASQIGTSRSTRRLSPKDDQQTIDGEIKSLMMMSMVLVQRISPPQEVPQPQCAAAAMMHGMAPASSLHGGCPPIQENQPYGFPGAFPGMVPMAA